MISRLLDGPLIRAVLVIPLVAAWIAQRRGVRTRDVLHLMLTWRKEHWDTLTGRRLQRSLRESDVEATTPS